MAKAMLTISSFHPPIEVERQIGLQACIKK